MSFFYVATPYSRYPGGLQAAFEMACEQTGLLIKAKVPVFCPIAHTHIIAAHMQVDPTDHAIWLSCDRPMMDAACGLIMVKAPSWEVSYGMKTEHEVFVAEGKPVFWMELGCVPEPLLGFAE